MDKIPPTPHNSPQDAESDDPQVIVDNLTTPELLQEAWNTECRTWAEMGMNPGQNIGVDMFKLNVQFTILLDMCIEKLDIDRAEFDDRVQRRMLAYMIGIRREFSRQMLQAELTKGIVGPQVPKDIFLPPGIKP